MTTQRVTRPGKFQCEPEYVEYFWELAMRGEADEENNDGDIPVSIFRINAEDCKHFPGEFYIGARLFMWEDCQGFVHHKLTEKGE